MTIHVYHVDGETGNDGTATVLDNANIADAIADVNVWTAPYKTIEAAITEASTKGTSGVHAHWVIVSGGASGITYSLAEELSFSRGAPVSGLTGDIDETDVMLMTDTTGVKVGFFIQGTGLAAGAFVLSIVTNVSVTMSAAATATDTGVSLVFGWYDTPTGGQFDVATETEPNIFMASTDAGHNGRVTLDMSTITHYKSLTAGVSSNTFYQYIMGFKILGDGTSQDCIKVSGSHFTRILNNEVDNRAHGILVSNSEFSTVAGNRVIGGFDGGLSGIKIENDTTDDGVVCNNYLTDIGTGSNPHFGIQAKGAVGLKICGNVIEGTSGTGIAVINGSTGVEIRGNSVTGSENFACSFLSGLAPVINGNFFDQPLLEDATSFTAGVGFAGGTATSDTPDHVGGVFGLFGPSTGGGGGLTTNITSDITG